MNNSAKAETNWDIIVIGGGAAGIFAAIQAAESGKRVLVLEKTNRLLTKVRISGGGRCNVTNTIDSPSELIKNYPRGGKKLKKLLHLWNTSDTQKWFEERGVPLKTEADGRVFPVSDSSEDIISCLLNSCQEAGAQIHLQRDVRAINPTDNGFEIQCTQGQSYFSKKIVAATGGSPSRKGLQLWEGLGLKIITPVPSLFTFAIPHKALQKLMGLSVPNASVYISGTKFMFSGPLLITHWGISGPAVLKLSAFAARELAACNYQFGIRINWLRDYTHENILENLESADGKKKLINIRPFLIPSRLWDYLCDRAGVDGQKTLNELSKKDKNRLADTLLNDQYAVNGKSTYKEEFVTAGGVALDELDLQDFSCKKIPGLHIIGELADMDGITGGFNFQLAWASAVAVTHGRKSDY